MLPITQRENSIDEALRNIRTLENGHQENLGKSFIFYCTVVWVKEQDYVSIFFTRFFYVFTPFAFNPFLDPYCDNI